MIAYYNENNGYAAAWLRALIDERFIPAGYVDERDIREVEPSDLIGFRQCHFFAGIAGWSRALHLAGWPDDRPIWTGSPPCQPFSVAGAGEGHGDKRHLWPAWFALIRECRPSIIVGEQVARTVGMGWLDTVALQLESEGYAVGAAILPACSVAAPHERLRLYFVADAGSVPERSGLCADQSAELGRAGSHHGGCAFDAAKSGRSRSQEREGVRSDRAGTLAATAASFEWPSESGLDRVVDGFPGRVDQIRALGNAIVPALAAEFIKAAIL